MRIFCFAAFTVLMIHSFPGFGQPSDFEKKIYPETLLSNEDFMEARSLGQYSSSGAIAAFDNLLKEFPLEQQPKEHLAIQYLLGASIHPYDQQKALDVYLSALPHSDPYPELHSRLLTRKAWAMVQVAHPEAVEAGQKAFEFTKENEFPASEQLNAITHYFAALHRSNQLNRCHEILGEYNRLLEACDEPEVKHTALSQLGRFYFEMGIHDKAAHYVEEDLKMCREALGDTSLMTTNAYITVGIVASQVGDYEKEIRYYEKAAEMLNYLISEEQYHHYSVYINLAHAYTNIDRRARAYNYYLKSLRILERLTSQKDPERSDVYSSLALYHAKSGTADSVLFYAGKVKEIFDGIDHGLKLQAYSKTGDALYQIGRIEDARQFHEELIATVDKQFDGKHFYKGRALLLKSEEAKNREEKLKLLREALAAVHPEFEYSADSELPKDAGFTDKTTARDVLLAKGKVLAETADSKDELLEVWRHVELGDELLEAIYKDQLSSAAIRTSKTAREFYALGLETLEKLYTETGEREYLASAYRIFQKSKGHLLGQFLNEKEFLTNADDSTKREINQLREEQFLIRQQLSGVEDDGQLQARLAEIDQQLKQLKDQLRSADPEYFKYVFEPTSLSLANARNYFQSRNATGIEYFVDRDRIFAISLSGEKVAVKSWRVDPQIAERAEKLLSQMQGMTALEYAEEAHVLYENLFEPLENEIGNRSVVVVPDAWIARLPMEILVSSSAPESAQFNELNYLINTYAFSYLYSADMLETSLAEKKRSENRELYLGVAPGFAGDQNQIAQVYRSGVDQPALIGAQREVESAAQIFQQQVRSSDRDLEELIKQDGNKYEILHLATHADIDEKSPLNSKIYLGKGSDENADDGILHQYELFNLDLDNELTVLSACKTGSGPWIEGEGVNSLARGFIYSGSKSIVLSYWDVHDQTSSNLMQTFFQNLKNGKGRSESLRSAKIEYLKQADAVQANPYYWAGFVLFGETTPLESTGSFGDFWLYAIPILVLIAVVLAYRIARISKKSKEESKA